MPQAAIRQPPPGRSGRITGLVSILGIAALLASCDITGPEPEGFIIRIDSISAPASLEASDSLVVRFIGVVTGPECRQSMSRTEFRSPSSLWVTFDGELRPPGSDCAATLVEFQHRIAVPAPLKDPFTITAEDGTGARLQQVVRVR
jgi:hypothetical protein